MRRVETIDLDDYDQVIDFIQSQSDRIEKLEQEIKDFQELLQKDDGVCYDRVISLIDDKIAAVPGVYIFASRHKSLQQIKQAYENGYLCGLKDLRKELVEDGED